MNSIKNMIKCKKLFFLCVLMLGCKTNLWGCINRLGGVTYQGPAPAIRALVVWLVRDVPTSDRGCHCITGSGWRTEKNNGGLVTLIGRQTEPDKSGPQRSMNIVDRAMSLLKPQSSHPKFTKFIDATGLVGCCCNRVASLLVLIWVEKTIRIHVYAGF